MHTHRHTHADAHAHALAGTITIREKWPRGTCEHEVWRENSVYTHTRVNPPERRETCHTHKHTTRTTQYNTRHEQRHKRPHEVPLRCTLQRSKVGAVTVRATCEQEV